MDNLKSRKVKKNFRLVNENGAALSDSDVEFKLVNHDFLFGCTANDFVFHNLIDDEEKKKLCKKRMEKWLRIFNYGTVQVYWGMYEREEGKTMFAPVMSAAKYLKENNVTLKGHPLCWHTVCADWLLKYDNETILKKQLARIRRDVKDFEGVIDIWDVINETVIMDKFDRYDNAVTRICRQYGKQELIKYVFDEAYRTNNNSTLLINDFNMSNAYVDVIKKSLDDGVPISVIGLQSHQHQGYWGLEKLEKVLSRFEPLGLPIHFTENTIVSGPKIPPEIEDLNDFEYKDSDYSMEFEEEQKNNIVEMYSAIFENHPQVTGITTWDFSDGAWLNAPSGLLRKDGTEKPSYKALDELINNRWNTREKIRTNKNGVVSVEGIKGTYEVSCNGKVIGSVKMSADSDNEELVVIGNLDSLQS